MYVCPATATAGTLVNAMTGVSCAIETASKAAEARMDLNDTIVMVVCSVWREGRNWSNGLVSDYRVSQICQRVD